MIKVKFGPGANGNWPVKNNSNYGNHLETIKFVSSHSSRVVFGSCSNIICVILVLLYMCMTFE